MNRRLFIIVGFLGLVIYLVAFRADGRFLRIVTEEGTHKLIVEIAQTDEEKRVGLMGRDELADGTGMLFIYEQNPSPVIWMRNMLIPIDIVFIGGDLKINYIEKSAEPCTALLDSECPRYRSSVASFYVLELPAGFINRQGIDVGDQIVLPFGI